MKINKFIQILFLLLCISPSLFSEQESTYKLGNRFYSDSLYNLAAEQYQKYLNGDGDLSFQADAIFKIGECYLHLEEYSRAAISFEKYVNQFSSRTDVIDAMYNAAISRRKSGDLREAGEWFYSVWSKYSGSIKARKALFEAARSYENIPDIQKATSLYEQYLKRFISAPNSKKVAIALLDIYLGQKKYEDAKSVILKIKKSTNVDEKFTINLLYYEAKLNWSLQQLKEASDLFAKLFKLIDFSFDKYEKYSLSYISFLKTTLRYSLLIKNYKSLEQYYQKKNLKLTYSFLSEYANAARSSKSWKLAERIYGIMQKDEYATSINLIGIKYRLAEIYSAQKDFPRSIEALRFIEANDSTGVYAVRAVRKSADLYLSRGLLLSAISSYRRYLQFDGINDRDFIIYRIGKIYQTRYKRYDSALREFDNLMKWYPASNYFLRATFSAAVCQEQLAQYEKAASNYRYVAESGGDENLVKKASRKEQYIVDFLIKNSSRAAYRLTSLFSEDSLSISKIKRLKVCAEIYEKDLKEFEKALDTYEKLETLILDNPKDIISIKFNKALLYEKLALKSSYSKTLKSRDYFLGKAIYLYSEIKTTQIDSSLASKAAYRLLKLNKPDIVSYENFLSEYKNSESSPEVLITLATLYRDKKDSISLIKASDLYRLFDTSFPLHKKDPEALSSLAHVLLDLGAIDASSEVASRYREKFDNTPFDAEVYFVRGSLYKQKGVLDSAIIEYKDALYRYPFSYLAERIRYELAETELLAKLFFDALSSFELYLQEFANGKYVNLARYGKAMSLTSLGRGESASIIFKELLDEKLPKEYETMIRYQLANYEKELGNNFKALSLYRHISDLEDFKNIAKVNKTMGELYFSARVFDSAAVAYERLTANSKTENDSLFAMTKSAISWIMAGNRKKSDQIIKSHKDRFGKDNNGALVEIIYYEGVHLISEKEYDNALKRFSYIAQNYDKSPWLDDAAYETALAYFYKNSIEKAQTLFEKFPEKFPTSELIPLALFKVGMIHFGHNEYNEAAKYFTLSLEHKSVTDDIRFRAAGNAATAYQKSSMWLKAAESYDIIINDYSDRVALSYYYLKKGFCNIQASRYKVALSDFLKASEKPSKEDQPEILYWIATSYAKNGNLESAVKEYLKVPYLYSSSGKWGITSEFEAARIYERLGKYSNAITLYNKIVRSDGERGQFGRMALDRLRLLKNIGG